MLAECIARIIDIWHHGEGEMGSSQHKSPHQARASRRALDVVTSAEISPSRLPNDAVCIFSYEYLSETVKSNYAVKRIGESVRWAGLTIRLVVKANSMSARDRMMAQHWAIVVMVSSFLHLIMHFLVCAPSISQWVHDVVSTWI